MTVYIAHAAGDAAVAERVARAFERVGIFVETEDGAHAFTPLKSRDLVVLLWSEALAQAGERGKLVERGFDAWAHDRLVLGAIDATPLDLVLRDLPLVRAGDDPVAAVGEAVKARLKAPPPEPVAIAPAAQAEKPKPAKRAPFGAIAALFFALTCAAGAAFGLSDHVIDGAAPWTTTAGLAAIGGAAALALTLVFGLLALVAGKPKPAPTMGDRALLLAGDRALASSLATALAEQGVKAHPVDTARTSLPVVEAVVIAGALADGASARAVALARRIGRPVVHLRVPNADASPESTAMLAGAPNAAWPGEPRAAAALALSLIAALPEARP